MTGGHEVLQHNVAYHNKPCSISSKDRFNRRYRNSERDSLEICCIVFIELTAEWYNEGPQVGEESLEEEAVSSWSRGPFGKASSGLLILKLFSVYMSL